MAAKWYYNSNSGAINQTDETLASLNLHLGLGWHGPFDTKETLMAYYTRNKAKNPGWLAPTGIPGAIANVTGVPGVVDAAKNALGMSDDDIRSWLIRIGEILLGVVLVGVGIAKLTGTTNAVAGLVKAKI